LASTIVFVGLIQLLGGPASGDAVQSTNSTWAIAHGQLACAFPRGQILVAPVYPLLSGAAAAIAHVGNATPFPGGTALGPHCDHAFRAIDAWSNRANPWTATIRIGYGSWLVLMVGIISLLRASGRGRCGWEPATLVVVACLPPVWQCVEDYFHPQDLVALGFALAALACARRDSWIGAGVLVALAVLSQQYALLVAAPLLVVAPSHRRVPYAASAIIATTVIVLPLLAVSSGSAAQDILLGTGNSAGNGGTLVSDLHLGNATIFLVSRVLPLALSMFLAAWVVRRLDRAALEPVALVAVVALSLSFRLVFERNFYGYYLMALAVTLVLLDVIRGRIRGSLVAWLTLVTLVYAVDPTWGNHVRELLTPIVITLAIVVVAFGFARGRLSRNYLLWMGLIGGTMLVWPSTNDPLSRQLPTVYWQLILVLGGMVLAATPLLALVRRRDDHPIALGRVHPG